MNPTISVVTPTHNRRGSVLRLLRALGDGGIPTEQLEVWVVADGCTDDTVVAIAGERFAFPVHVLEQMPARGSAAARNLGAAHARGELLIFLDDDIEPFPGILAAHQRAHRDLAAPAVVVGPSLPVRRPGADWRTVGAWDWWEGRFAQMRRPGHRFQYEDVFSGNLSIPAAFFQQLGGFDAEILCRHDYDLGLRVIRGGGRVAYAADAAGWHHEARGHSEFQERKLAEGSGDVELVKRHPELWPVLLMSHPIPRANSMKGLLRRLAFEAPWLGDLVARGFVPALSFFEYFRMRGVWARARARLTYYAYWRGVAAAVGSRASFTRIRCAGKEAADAADPREVELDLRDGLTSAERRLDEERPDSAYVRVGSIEVGRIPARPGAEPLRGAHLRPALATSLAQPLIAALEARGAIGDPRAWDPPDPALPAVSVVVPAYNADKTLAETLESLLAQTHPYWEAIVIDDGSTDDTTAVAQSFAERDERIRLIRLEHGGVGRARNTGIADAQNSWILFLDADDRLLPRAIGLLAQAVEDDKSLDGVHGGWVRVRQDGTPMDPEFQEETGELFELFSQRSLFPIHACLLRTRCARDVGGFDPLLRSCQDWDFWQRIARTGARFGRVAEPVAEYWMRPGSVTADTRRYLEDGLLVILRGHGSDSRVPDPVHLRDASEADLQRARIRFFAWMAGTMIGRGEDALATIHTIAGAHAPDLDADDLAELMFRSIPMSKTLPLEMWDDLWPLVADPTRRLLEILESISGAQGLARRAGITLESLALDVSRLPRPFTRGSTRAIRVEVTNPLPIIEAPKGVEHVHCVVEVEGERIGTLWLPISNTMILPDVLADAISRDLAWKVLFQFFRRHHYRALQFSRAPSGVVVHRGQTIVEESLTDELAVDPRELHDRVGWTTFLQDLCGRPEWTEHHFYDCNTNDPEEGPEFPAGDKVAVEISWPLPCLRTDNPTLDVEVRLGGATVDVVQVSPVDGVVPPQQLRSAIICTVGLKLVRVAVREGMLGSSFDAPAELRERLSSAARSQSGSTRIPKSTDEVAVPSRQSDAQNTRRMGTLFHPRNSFLGTARFSGPRTRSAAKVRKTMHAVPLQVMDLEVGDGVPIVDNERGYGGAYVLLRLRRRPLALVTLIGKGQRFGPEEILTGWDDVYNSRAPLLIEALYGRDNLDHLPPISIVVCTRDRPDQLARCLRSLAALEYPAYEVIVVDNASTSDATRQETASAGARYVREPNPGLDRARNCGLEEALHDIVAYTDDDVEVDRGWLAGIAQGFGDPHVMAVTGMVVPAALDTEAEVLFELCYGGMGKGTTSRRWDPAMLSVARLIGAHHVGVGANMAFRRPFLRQLGGFDTALDVGTPSSGGGDLDMFHRVLVAGGVIQYEPQALVRHHHRREMDALERQHRDSGRAFGVYLLKILRRGSVSRAVTARYLVRVWLPWLMRRAVRGFLGHEELPDRLLRAELLGALGAPRAYLATYRQDRRKSEDRITESTSDVG